MSEATRSDENAAADMSRRPVVVLSHINSEGEYASIERVAAGPFEGQHLLVIHDDPPSSVRAPMLLDNDTIQWLRRAFIAVEEATRAGGGSS